MGEHLKVAICEDTKSDQELLLGILNSSTISNEVVLFDRGEDLLVNYHSGMYDLIFMDIYMDGKSGIDTISELRKIDHKTDIAFTTTSLDFTLESYRLEAIKYIEKPVKDDAIFQLLEYIQMKKSFIPKLFVKTKTGNEFIPLPNIVYIEQKGSICYFICTGNITVESHIKLNDVKSQLSDESFYQCHKSYIVNFSFVRLLNRELNVFEMIEGGNVHIRRDSYWKTKRAYEDYLFNVSKVGISYE